MMLVDVLGDNKEIVKLFPVDYEERTDIISNMLGSPITNGKQILHELENQDSISVVGDDLLGWGPYNTLLKCVAEGFANYYLAEVVDVKPRFQYAPGPYSLGLGDNEHGDYDEIYIGEGRDKELIAYVASPIESRANYTQEERFGTVILFRDAPTTLGHLKEAVKHLRSVYTTEKLSDDATLTISTFLYTAETFLEQLSLDMQEHIKNLRP